MKKILILLLAIFILPFLYDTYILKTPILRKKIPFTNKKTISKSEKKTIKFNSQDYSYYYFSPDAQHQLIFDLNLSEKKTSLDIISDQGCEYLVNGGFYNKEDQPIGLVIKDGLEISKSQKNSLFNGFVSATSSASFSISTTKPSLESVAAIQTGPVLISNFETQKLNLVTDEHKRRIILIITKENTPIFMAITLSENEIEGPLLGELPKLLTSIQDKENIVFKDAINLDGGSASVFYAPDTHINELTTIGSYFCFKL